MNLISVKPKSEYYSALKEKTDHNILHLKDARGVFLLDKVDERNQKYFMNQIIEMPWCNHMLFTLLIQADRNLDPKTTVNLLTNLHPRMKDLFHFHSLQEMREFNTEVHMYSYLKGEFCPEHSNNMRSEFLNRYKSQAYHTKKWLTQKLNQWNGLYLLC